MPADRADDAARIAALLADDDVDAAITAGLMDVDTGTLPADAQAAIQIARERLRTAWAARDRFQARTERLAARAAERDARRRGPAIAKPAEAPASATAFDPPPPAQPPRDASTRSTAGDATASTRSALPDAAAAALARARARAAARRP